MEPEPYISNGVKEFFRLHTTIILDFQLVATV